MASYSGYVQPSVAFQIPHDPSLPWLHLLSFLCTGHTELFRFFITLVYSGPDGRPGFPIGLVKP